MIPKTIHYCWFGKKELPELALRCIESWKRYCPDYKIKEWNELNFDLNICDYVKEAYRQKKWAFVSDYARFWILYHEGGLYFDTDVEILKPIDSIIEKGAFFGFERREQGDENQFLVATGLGMGAEAGNDIYREVLDLYNILHFINKNGTLNKKTVVSYVTEILQNHGLRKDSATPEDIIVIEGIRIYPWEYFCPMSYKTGDICITENSYLLHHYTASWKSKDEMRMKAVSDILKKRLGRKGENVAKYVLLPIKFKAKIKQVGLWKTVNIIIHKK